MFLVSGRLPRFEGTVFVAFVLLNMYEHQRDSVHPDIVRWV